MNPFPHLFSLLQVGPITVKNRILVPAHGTLMGLDEKVSEQYIAYIAARAAGGPGLIVTQAMSVHPTSRVGPKGINLWDRAGLPALGRLTERVHSFGVPVLAQLHHAGREQPAAYTQQAPWAPSPVPTPLYGEVPHEMSREEIREIVQAYAFAAETAVLGGYDGVELSAGHGYLINQFTSPGSNKRTDEYGGPLENRVRFACETVRAVRERLKGHVVGVRVNGDEFRPEGSDAEECKRIALLLDAEGVDYISVSAAHMSTPWITYPPMGTPLGTLVPLAAAIKKQARAPVFVSHRIKKVELAEQIVAQGHADMVGMARAHIADPELARKAAEGRVEDIRPCIGVMQGCADRGSRGFHIACTVNPAVGREAEYAIVPARERRTVAVVGGGPAGLEAARVLSLRGHYIHLFEATGALGGKVLLAASLPHRGEFLEIIEWLTGQIRKLGVQVHLNREFTVETARHTVFDAVVLASGAVWQPPPTRYGPDVPHWGVVQATTFDGDMTGKTVLILDREHHNKALNLAMKYSLLGARVLVAAEGRVAAQNLDLVNRGVGLRRLGELGVKLISHATVLVVGKDGTRIDHEGWELALPPLDLLVVVEKPVADPTLECALRKAFPSLPLYPAGDCFAPRLCVDAVHDGHRVGLAI